MDDVFVTLSLGNSNLSPWWPGLSRHQRNTNGAALTKRFTHSIADETKVAFVGSIDARKFRMSEGAGGFFDKQRCKAAGAGTDQASAQYLRE